MKKIGILAIGILLLLLSNKISAGPFLEEVKGYDKPLKWDAHTVVLCHFEESTSNEDGQEAVIITGEPITYEEGKFGKGLSMKFELKQIQNKLLAYRVPKNFRERGTIECWIKINWDAGSKKYWDKTDKQIRWLFVDGDTRLRVCAYEGTYFQASSVGEWREKHYGLVTPMKNWFKGDWYHIIVCWDHELGAALYIDGKLQDKRACSLIPWEPNQNEFSDRMLYIGNIDAVVDELRISDNARHLSEGTIKR